MKALIEYNPATPAVSGPAMTVGLPLSKSLSNRLLIINALAGIGTAREHVAECDDTNAMLQALAADRHGYVNIGAAGTAMRFLTAYYATLPGCDITLDGSDRMRQRPIGILVDALRQLGADITCLEREGYPPLHIKGRILDGGAVEIDGSVSSQYTSALLMTAPAMTLGMELTLKGTPVSLDYIEMTTAMMNAYGINTIQQSDDSSDLCIKVNPGSYRPPLQLFRVEADWSASSYWYEVAALTGKSFTLRGLQSQSLQGDSIVSYIFRQLGVTTRLNNDSSVTIEYDTDEKKPTFIELNMQSCPDLAQTVAATCCGLGIPFRLTGLSTLPIKETDRLEALRRETARLGYLLTVSHGSILEWDGSTVPAANDPVIETYKDHRMAMAMAPLAAVNGRLTIENPAVVSKSYPDFWKHLADAGYQINQS